MRYRSDIKRKSDPAIERETSKTWYQRALDAYREYTRTGMVTWLMRADRFKHEALEHAAGVGDHGSTVGKMQRDLDDAAKKAKRKR